MNMPYMTISGAKYTKNDSSHQCLCVFVFTGIVLFRNILAEQKKRNTSVVPTIVIEQLIKIHP